MNPQSMSHQGALTKIAVFKSKKIRKIIYKSNGGFQFLM